MSAPTPRFWSGICHNPRCGKSYIRKSCRPPDYCNDRCRKDAWQVRRRDRGPDHRTYAVKKEQYASRTEEILARVASGELTEVPGNCCPTCYEAHREAVVETGTDPLTGRTWERCGCGFKWIGRWAA